MGNCFNRDNTYHRQNFDLPSKPSPPLKVPTKPTDPPQNDWSNPGVVAPVFPKEVPEGLFPAPAPYQVPIAFRLSDIMLATKNFHDEMILGEGGFGKVYRGFLSIENSGRTQVAVKRLNVESSGQGHQEWLAEILMLGRLAHENLIKLYGYSAEVPEMVLVYPFLPLGSLDYHLFYPDPNEFDSSFDPISWESRLKIAYGTAAGLAYLHKNNIIHRDFKAANVLLDAEYNPVITDFGLAKAAPTDQTHVSTRIMGTLGYLDPKYMETGQLTKKSDVYSYGVFLLELLSGRKAMENNVSITKWAGAQIHQRKPDINEIVDKKILSSVTSKTMQKAAQKLIIAARHCVEEDPALRPSMSDIVETLLPVMHCIQTGAPTVPPSDAS